MSATDELTNEILKYLLVHPDAEDTLDGIARFWVARQQIELRIEQTKAALNDLVGRGYLKVHRHPEGSGGSPTFCVDQSKLTEILKVLSTSEGEETNSTNPRNNRF